MGQNIAWAGNYGLGLAEEGAIYAWDDFTWQFNHVSVWLIRTVVCPDPSMGGREVPPSWSKFPDCVWVEVDLSPGNFLLGYLTIRARPDTEQLMNGTVPVLVRSISAEYFQDPALCSDPVWTTSQIRPWIPAIGSSRVEFTLTSATR